MFLQRKNKILGLPKFILQQKQTFAHFPTSSMSRLHKPESKSKGT